MIQEEEYKLLKHALPPRLWPYLDRLYDSATFKADKNPVGIPINEVYSSLTGYAILPGWRDAYFLTLKAVAIKYPNGLKIIDGEKR